MRYRPLVELAKRPLTWLVAVAIAGAVTGIVLAGGGGHQPPGKGTTTTATSGPPSPAYRPGRCAAGGCHAANVRRYNLNVPDSDATGCGIGSCGTPATVTPAVLIERPRNLTSAPAPLVIAFSGSVAGDPNWIAASASDAFVFVSIGGYHHCSGQSGCQYAATTSVDSPIGVGVTGVRPNGQDCGTTQHLTCDDIPEVAAVIRALESCASATGPADGRVGTWVRRGATVPPYGNDPALPGNGAPPCEHVNPREVFVEGGSRGGGMTLDAVCDTRTTHLIAGASVISEVMISPGATARTLPNCPALIPFDRATCIVDCVAASPNAHLSLQFLWGDEDPNHPRDTSLCDRTVSANDCAGVGYAAPGRWVFGDIKLATSVLGKPALGCSTSPARRFVTGTRGLITVTTYAGCTDPNVATQTVRVSGGGHLPDTWPYGRTVGIICASRCVNHHDTNADGLVEPLAAWSFWAAHVP